MAIVLPPSTSRTPFPEAGQRSTKPELSPWTNEKPACRHAARASTAKGILAKAISCCQSAWGAVSAGRGEEFLHDGGRGQFGNGRGRSRRLGGRAPRRGDA